MERIKIRVWCMSLLPDVAECVCLSVSVFVCVCVYVCVCVQGPMERARDLEFEPGAGA